EALDGATGTGIHRHGEQQVGNRLWQGIALHRVPIHGPVEVKDLVVGERLQVVHGRVWFTSTATPTGEGRERDPHVGVPARVRGVVHIAPLSLQDEAQGTAIRGRHGYFLRLKNSATRSKNPRVPRLPSNAAMPQAASGGARR